MPKNSFYEFEKKVVWSEVLRKINAMKLSKISLEMPKFKMQDNIGLKKVSHLYLSKIYTVK